MKTLIRRIINKLNYYNIIKDIKYYKFKYRNKYIKRIGLVSCCDKKDKVLDDLLLKRALFRKGIDTDIIAFEDKDIDYKKYDALIITSMWNYQDKIDEFKSFLDRLKKDKVKVFNSTDIISNNYEKDKQFEILDKYDVPHIKTMIVPKGSKDILKYIDSDEELVIKPCISGSAHNTFILNSNRKNSISKNDVNEKFKDIINDCSLMVQPFIKEVDDGEISLVYIDKKFSHSVKRYTSCFNNMKGISLIDVKIDEELESIINKIHNIKEYKDYLYMRIDVIKSMGRYTVMELELIEPQLFFFVIKDKKKQDLILNNYIDELLKRI